MIPKPRQLNKEKEDELFKLVLAKYKSHWDKNQYYRDNHDVDLEYYEGYRNANDYPLAYNTSHNRILPIIYTLLSRFMDQLYQAGNVISVKPKKKGDVERAKIVEGLLNHQMENLNDIDCQGGSYLTMMKWFYNTITFGKGVAKAYWRKEERISPRRIMVPKPKFDRAGRYIGNDVMDYVNQEMQTVYDGPYVEILHNKLFLPDVEYKNIQQMPMCFLVYRRTMDEVKQLADKGIYKNMNELSKTSAGGAGTEPTDSREAFIKSLNIEGAFIDEDNRSNEDYISPYVDIIECYGKFILDDEPYEVGSGLQIKGVEKECILHIGNYKTFLSVQENSYGVRPLFDMGCYMQPELYWDLGLVRLTRGLQEQINNLANLRLQSAMMMINPMLLVDTNSDVDPQALTFKPFGIIPVDDTVNEVRPLIIPDTNSNLFMEQEMFYKNTIQDIMGMYDYNMGVTPQRQERVGVVHGIQAMGEARAKLMLMSMDYLGIRPLLKYMMLLNTFHLPSGFEFKIGASDSNQFQKIFGGDIHPNFDFSARYTAMEPALGKAARAQQLVQMAQMWAQSPWINQYQLNKTIMELLDIREAEVLMKTPQQLQQESQQNAKMQMMAKQAEKQFETDGKIKVSDKDFQEDLVLNEQEFGHNLALEAIKAENAESSK